MTFLDWQATVRNGMMQPERGWKLIEIHIDKAASGVGYVEDHQNPVEFMQKDEVGIGKFGLASDKLKI
jgi:hypothetical protein